MRHVTLSSSPIVAPYILALLLLSGCGGGGDDADFTVAPLVRESRYITVDTGATAGGRSNLGVVRVEAVFQPVDAQRLTTRWNPIIQDQPPPRFQVQVTRFFDADGTTGKAIGQPMDADYLERKSSEFLESPARVLEKGWDFRRPTDNPAPLFVPGGVYIVDVQTPDGVSYEGFTYHERMQPRLFIAPGIPRGSTDDDANGVSVETKAVERENGVQSLNVNASGLTSIARTKDILLSGTPPKNWEVFLRRYKEARDGRPYSETAQPITVEEVTPTSWRLRRQGNVPLDPHAVYVIEIRRTGSGGGIRHLFITDGE